MSYGCVQYQVQRANVQVSTVLEGNQPHPGDLKHYILGEHPRHCGLSGSVSWLYPPLFSFLDRKSIWGRPVFMLWACIAVSMCEFESLSRALRRGVFDESVDIKLSSWTLWKHRVHPDLLNTLKCKEGWHTTKDADSLLLKNDVTICLVFKVVLLEIERISNRFHAIVLGASLQNKKVNHHKDEQVRIEKNHSCGE